MSSITLKERHIDRILAEELESSSTFLCWFAEKVFKEKIPKEKPCSCKTTIGYYRVSGETDIFVELNYDSEISAVIHVEDKLTALPQPSQAERYNQAVDSHKKQLAACALVAPEAWIRRHTQEVQLYNAIISFEEIASEFGKRAKLLSSDQNPVSQELSNRLRWREQLFNGALDKKAVYSALSSGELTDWNKAAAALIEATNGLILNVSQRQKTTGKSKEARFIRFETPFLKSYKGKSPILKLKTRNSNYPGRISLEIPDAANDYSLRKIVESEIYMIDDTKSGTLIISDSTPLMEELTISKPVSKQVEQVEESALVAQKIIEWWQTQFNS